MVITLVSTSKLKTDFKKYGKDELEKLSAAECDDYVESLVIELMKPYQKGMIIFDSDDNDEIVDIIDSYMEFAKTKFNNADAVLLNRKFRYLANAYFTAHINKLNNIYDSIVDLLKKMVFILDSNKTTLKNLLTLYYDNYSNYGMLNDLFFKLSTIDDLDITFEIHEKYLNNEFGVNTHLMKDLDYLIKSHVDLILEIIDKIEKTFDVDDLAADDYFDKTVDAVKSSFKKTLNIRSNFEKAALINSGYDSSLFHQVENAKDETELIANFLDLKKNFMDLYNNNGFAEISAERFEYLHKKFPDKYDDFDEYMKNEPKYDLKKCEFIKPEKERKAF